MTIYYINQYSGSNVLNEEALLLFEKLQKDSLFGKGQFSSEKLVDNMSKNML